MDKDTHDFHVHFPIPLWERISAWSDEHGQAKKIVVCRAVSHALGVESHPEFEAKGKQ
jgi:hypothetical protein